MKGGPDGTFILFFIVWLCMLNAIRCGNNDCLNITCNTIESYFYVASFFSYKFEFPTPDDRPGPPIISFRSVFLCNIKAWSLFGPSNFIVKLQSMLGQFGRRSCSIRNLC